MLVPGFLPSFLPRVFPAGARFMDLGISEEALWSLDGNPVHHRPTLHPDTVTELEASGLPLFPFFFFPLPLFFHL